MHLWPRVTEIIKEYSSPWCEEKIHSNFEHCASTMKGHLGRPSWIFKNRNNYPFQSQDLQDCKMIRAVAELMRQRLWRSVIAKTVFDFLDWKQDVSWKLASSCVQKRTGQSLFGAHFMSLISLRASKLFNIFESNKRAFWRSIRESFCFLNYWVHQFSMHHRSDWAAWVNHFGTSSAGWAEEFVIVLCW